MKRLCINQDRFLSTLPARGATHDPKILETLALISIHAPREGSDDTTTGETYRVTSISIHARTAG